MMKYIGLLFTGIVLSLTFINAQTDFREGYIIRNAGDTLYGEIDYRGDLLMGNRCKFKVGKAAEIIEYTPDDIIAYRFINSRYYVSKAVNGKNSFLEFLIKGRVNIYYLRDDIGDHYYIEKDSIAMTEIPYVEKQKYIDNKPYLYQSNTHIGILTYYMKDAPGFKDRIAQIDKPEHQKLIKLAEDYHNKVCKDESCIIFEKRQTIKVNLEVIGGVVNYENVEYLNDKYFFQAGVLTHFWLPRTNEKLYWKTGTIYTTIERNSISEAYLIIPIQIEYMYPESIIKPEIAYGMNIYLPFDLSAAVSGGLNIKLYKLIHWSVKYNIDFIPYKKLPIIPSKLLSQSILTGFYIEF